MLDRARRIVRANQAAETALSVPLAGRDLIAVLRSPQVIDAVAGAFDSGAGRIVEFSLPCRSSAASSPASSAAAPDRRRHGRPPHAPRHHPGQAHGSHAASISWPMPATNCARP